MQRTNWAPITKRKSIKELARASKRARPVKKEITIKNCPNYQRISGYGHLNLRCKKCQSTKDCKSKTIKRILSVEDDVNRNLFGDGLFDFNYGEGISYWQIAENPDDLDEDWFDERRAEIKYKITEWVHNHDENGYNTEELQDRIRGLNKKTQFYLNNIWPEWKAYTKQFIDNVHVTDTNDLEKLKWSLRIPYYIMDKYMKDMSASAWKVFCYIARRATFNPEDPKFGCCWLGYELIQEWTGVKTIERYVKELMDMNLIEVEHIKKRNPATGKVVTVNKFTVNWFGEFEELKVDGYKK